MRRRFARHPIVHWLTSGLLVGAILAAAGCTTREQPTRPAPTSLPVSPGGSIVHAR